MSFRHELARIVSSLVLVSGLSACAQAPQEQPELLLTGPEGQIVLVSTNGGGYSQGVVFSRRSLTLNCSYPDSNTVSVSVHLPRSTKVEPAPADTNQITAPTISLKQHCSMRQLAAETFPSGLEDGLYGDDGFPYVPDSQDASGHGK